MCHPQASCHPRYALQHPCWPQQHERAHTWATRGTAPDFATEQLKGCPASRCTAADPIKAPELELCSLWATCPALLLCSPSGGTISPAKLKLLDEIIDIAVDNKQPITTLLRKCIVLAHQLNERLKVWSKNGELNGYSSIVFKNIEPLEQQRLDSLLALVGHAFSRAYLLQYWRKNIGSLLRPHT